MAEKEAESGLSTTHLYYADTELLSNVAKVIGEHTVEFNGGQLVAVVLNETVMHPQGGMCSTNISYSVRGHGVSNRVVCM